MTTEEDTPFGEYFLGDSFEDELLLNGGLENPNSPSIYIRDNSQRYYNEADAQRRMERKNREFTLQRLQMVRYEMMRAALRKKAKKEQRAWELWEKYKHPAYIFSNSKELRQKAIKHYGPLTLKQDDETIFDD
jgi:hypothetical protein